MPATEKMTKRWCFTVNNPGEWKPEYKDGMDFLIWQYEIGENGTEHIQGYVRFANRKRMSTAKRELTDRAHMEPAKGTEADNKAYCTKAETRKAGTEPTEKGTFKGEEGKQGKRTDLEEIAQEIKSGAAMTTIAEKYPADFIRYHQGLQALQETIAPRPPVARDVTVWVWWGPTGVGKTHRARTAFPEIYDVIPGRDTWGHYRGEKEILFDEFNHELWTIQEMNRFLDKWRCPLSCRYRDKYAAWTLVVICSNSPPESWWPQHANSFLMNAFLRRISATTYVSTKEQEVLVSMIPSSSPTMSQPSPISNGGSDALPPQMQDDE